MAEICDSDYSNISQKLDELALQILDIMQTIILERQYLDDGLKDGFINLAKSRYLMRGQKISTLQINTSSLRSSKKVIGNSRNHNGVEFISYEVSTTIKEKESMEGKSDTGDGLRNLKFDYSDKCEENTTVCDSSNEFNSCAVNPLNWFGVLVPNTLKDCQSRFDQVIETSVKIVSLQSQLKALSQEYKNLRLEKFKFVTAN